MRPGDGAALSMCAALVLGMWGMGARIVDDIARPIPGAIRAFEPPACTLCPCARAIEYVDLPVSGSVDPDSVVWLQMVPQFQQGSDVALYYRPVTERASSRSSR